MKERGNQLFKDKFVLVMLVLGLLTIVAAAGAVRIQKGRENIGESPYLEIEDPDHVIAGDSNAGAESGGDTLAGELAAWQTIRMVPELALIPAILPEKFRWILVLLMHQIAP